MGRWVVSQKCKNVPKKEKRMTCLTLNALTSTLGTSAEKCAHHWLNTDKPWTRAPSWTEENIQKSIFNNRRWNYIVCQWSTIGKTKKRNKRRDSSHYFTHKGSQTLTFLRERKLKFDTLFKARNWKLTPCLSQETGSVLGSVHNVIHHYILVISHMCKSYCTFLFQIFHKLFCD